MKAACFGVSCSQGPCSSLAPALLPLRARHTYAPTLVSLFLALSWCFSGLWVPFHCSLYLRHQSQPPQVSIHNSHYPCAHPPLRFGMHSHLHYALQPKSTMKAACFGVVVSPVLQAPLLFAFPLWRHHHTYAPTLVSSFLALSWCFSGLWAPLQCSSASGIQYQCGLQQSEVYSDHFTKSRCSPTINKTTPLRTSSCAC